MDWRLILRDPTVKRRWGFCIKCGGRIVLARENEYYTATEPCYSSCGLVYSEELTTDLLTMIFLMKMNRRSIYGREFRDRSVEDLSD